MEELKLILQALTTLDEVGKEAFIWWLIMEKGLLFLIMCVFFSVIWFCISKIYDANASHNTLRQLRDLMGIGYINNVTDTEINEMINWIRQRDK